MVGKAPSSIYKEEDFRGSLPAPVGYQDVSFSIAFILHLVGTIALFGVGYNHWKHQDVPAEPSNMYSLGLGAEGDDGLEDIEHLLPKILTSLGVAAITSVMLAVCYLFLASRYPRQLIVAAIVIHCSLYFIMGGMYLVTKPAEASSAPAIMFLIFGLIAALVYFLWRRRIPFAAAVLATAANVIRGWPATVYSGVPFTLVSILFVIFWTYTAHYTLYWAKDATLKILAVYLVLSLHWTTEVVRNVYACTIAGVTSTWYFLGGAQGAIPANPTLKAAKRAVTTSFGSICFGSLVVALIETARSVVRSMRSRRNALLFCILECMLSCIESLVRYFNSYAYAIVATYGMSYCDSAKLCFKMFKEVGFFALVNDMIVFRVIALTNFAGALFGALVGGVSAYVMVHGHAHATGMVVALCALAGFIVAFVIFAAFNSVLGGAIRTIFVNFVMEPEALRRNDEFLYAEFSSTMTLL